MKLFIKCFIIVTLYFLVILALLYTAVYFICRQIDYESRTRELPAAEIRSMFQDMTDCSLPERTENFRAMFSGGREPAIFVRFETDSEGIEYVLKIFDKSGLMTKKIDADSKLSNIIFLSPFSWQKEIGVEIFDLDKEPVESGFKIENNPHTAPNFELVIDSQRNTVYIFVYYT